MSEHDEPEPDHATKREGKGSGSRPSRPESEERAERLERGTSLGRYIVLGELGSGGMGVVYAAYDPELDRKVAVKLLQGEAAGESVGGQAWLLREAQAMARLSHPNVIAVYDVGTLSGDRVFVAMELVEGPSLRAWLGEEHPWREVVSVMAEAGRGLAAAHASGLVHRDFKPDNVLIGKERVRVMDFGLARLQTDKDPALPDHQIETRSPLSAHLTIAGTLVGTPAYMAPELRRGQPAGPRTDQFSFGVALYEALYRQRPFSSSGKTDAKPRPIPEGSKVPARLQRLVMRAIAPDPAQRFESMEALLDELEVDLGARRRRVLIGAAAVVLVAGAVGGGFALSRGRSEVCTGFETRLAGTWDAPTKLKIKTAFEATKRPFAAREYGALEKSVDAYTNDWIATAVDSCKATRVRGEQTEEALSLRQACLDRRRDELRELTRVLGDADAELVENADKLASGLEPLRRCADVAALRAPGRVPTEPADKVAKAEQLLAEAKAGLITGRHFASINAAKQAQRIAEELHYAPYVAEALVIQGASLTGAGNGEESGAACTAAVWKAIEGHRDDLAAGAALCSAATASQHKIGEAKIWIQLARTFANRNGIDPEIEVRALEVEGLVEAMAGNLDAAVAAQQKALAAAERVAGPGAPSLWRDEEVIGTTYARAGAWEKALPYLEKALAIHEAEVGGEHPDIATILTTLGAAYSKIGQPAKSRAAYERGLAIHERVEGKDSPALVVTLNNMADGLIKAGDIPSALVYLDRAKDLAARSLGDANPMTHAVLTTRAEALAASGKLAESRAAYDEVLALETKASSPLLGQTLASRMTTELGAKQWTDAAGFAQRALVAIEATGGKDSPDLVLPLGGLARAYVELGRRAEAKPLLARALALADKAQLAAVDVKPLHELLTELEAKP